jgi:hypothetical protein
LACIRAWGVCHTLFCGIVLYPSTMITSLI